MFNAENPQDVNHLNSSKENLVGKLEELKNRKSEITHFYDEFRFAYFNSDQDKEEISKKREELLNSLLQNKELENINEEIHKLNREIMSRHRKDLATNYLVTQMFLSDLYQKMFDLPEGDVRLKEIEDKIVEFENLLKNDIKSLNSEGLSEDLVKNGGY